MCNVCPYEKIPIFRNADDDFIKNYVTMANVAMVDDRTQVEQLSCKVSSPEDLLLKIYWVRV